MSQMNIRIFLIFFLLIFSLEVNASYSTNFSISDFANKSELIFVHVLFRHGDRNPLWQLPGVPYNVSYWPEGWGQLTSIGKEQHLKLGKWLRSRYNDFLDSTYKANDIYVQSSDFDRTIMSAQANLAGLYPPIKNDNCNPDLWWQLIPVHTRVWKTDYLIGGKVPKYCRGYYKELAKYYKTPEAQNMLTKAQPYFEFLTNKTGKSIHTTKMLTYIRDSWIVQSDHKFRIPKWAKKLLHEDKQFYKVALFTYEAMCATPKLAKYFSGFLFKKILDRFTSKVQKTLYPNRKFWIYSSHDTAVISFAKALNIFDNEFPDYTATFILELRRYKNEHYVQIIYKNFEAEPKLIDIPGCGLACPLWKIKQLYANILPKHSFEKECQIY